MNCALKYIYLAYLQEMPQKEKTGSNCSEGFTIWPDVNEYFKGFSGCSGGKESTCSAGDTSLIPGSGRSPGERTGYPLQYSWASLVAQLAKNPPTMRETWIRSLGWEDPLETGKATHSSILAWRIPWTWRIP